MGDGGRAAWVTTDGPWGSIKNKKAGWYTDGDGYNSITSNAHPA